MLRSPRPPVIPAKAGIQSLRKMPLVAASRAFCEKDWVPAFAGTTGWPSRSCHLQHSTVSLRSFDTNPGEAAMTDDFEDHCWKDIVTPELLETYAIYRRKTFVGPSPALLAIDLYEVVYAGGAQPPHKLAKSHPNSCGEYAHAAIEPTKRLLAAARAAGLPIFYSTGDTRAASRPGFVAATKRNRPPVNPADYAIRPEFKPEPED